MQLTPQLVDAETQTGGHGRRGPFLIEVVVVVEAGGKVSGRFFVQDRAPLGRDITVLIAIIILRTERELVFTPIAIHFQAMQIVEFPCQHTTEVIEVCYTVLVAALLWQFLEDPVTIGRTAIQ